VGTGRDIRGTQETEENSLGRNSGRRLADKGAEGEGQRLGSAETPYVVPELDCGLWFPEDKGPASKAAAFTDSKAAAAAAPCWLPSGPVLSPVPPSSGSCSVRLKVLTAH